MNNLYAWLILLITYLPLQIALNPGANFDLASVRLFIVILSIIWFGKNILNRKAIKKICSVNIQTTSLLIFLVLAGISLFYAQNVFWGMRKIIYFLSIFPLYVLVVSLIDNYSKIKKTFLVLLGSAGLIGLIGLLQFLSQYIFTLEKVYAFWAIHVLPIFSGFNLGSMILAYPSWLVNIKGQTIMRAFSVFSDPHMLSFYLGLILPSVVIVLYIFKNKRRQDKLIIIFTYYLLFVVLLCTFARGSYLAIIATLLVLSGLAGKYLSSPMNYTGKNICKYVFNFLESRKIALCFCIPLLIFILPFTSFSDRFYSSFDLNEGSNTGRLEMWQRASQMGWQHIWQGVGLGNYALSMEARFDYRNPATAHNFYLDLFSEMGIFSVLAWLILILGTVWQLFSKLKNSTEEQKCIIISLIGSLVYFSVHSVFETAVYSPVVLSLFMIILGLSVVVIKKET